MKELVTSVITADTFVTFSGEKIRLEGVGASHINIAKAIQAKEKLTELVLNKYVDYEQQARDIYGIIIARVWVDSIDVNKAINSLIEGS